MGNMNELDNVKDVSDFLNSHGITGKNMLSQGCKNEKDLIAMKLLDLERKGYVKFEKGLGYEIIDRNYTGLLESDQMILYAINDGIVKLNEEGKIRARILNELYRIEIEEDTRSFKESIRVEVKSNTEPVNSIKEKTETVFYRAICEKVENIDIFSSKLGGIPYWDLNRKFPTDSKGNKLALLAQINFEKEKFEDEKMPKTGIVQIFVATDDTNGLNFEAQDVQKDWKIIYHEKIN